MLVSLTVGKVDAGVAVLLTQDKRLIEFPSILLPPNISSGSIVDITVARNYDSERAATDAFHQLQDSILASFGEREPSTPVLRCRNATQTSIVLEWDPVDLATSDIISLSMWRNGQKAGNIPKPMEITSSKVSGLAVDTDYTFQLVLKTTAGAFQSEKLTVRTHKMTDLSGITVTPGILPAQLRESLSKAVERIGAKMTDEVRIDTTHFVTTEPRGIQWEKAVEQNIPVVRPEWVEGCERSGRIVGVRQYYLDADPRQRMSTMGGAQPGQQPSPHDGRKASVASSQQTSGSQARREEAPLPALPGQDNPTINGHTPESAAKMVRETHEEEARKKKEEEERQKKEDESDDESEVETEQKTESADEQKVSDEDREQQKLAMRPKSPQDQEMAPKSPAKTSEEESRTPGDAGFQDVAL